MAVEAVRHGYARLVGMKGNAKDYWVQDPFIREFHSILDLLETNSGIDLSAYKVPDSELSREVTGGNLDSGEQYFGNHMVVRGDFFRMKLDQVLMLFDIADAKIGFGGKS